MEIESYEPYHIGIKLNPATNLDSLKSKLKEKLNATGYYETEKTPSGQQQTIFGLPFETLGTKNDVRVELNYLAQALNVIGTKPVSVSEVFTEITSILPGIGFELDKTSLFYEIVSSIVIKSDDKPADLLNKSVNLNIGTLSLNDLDLNIIGVKVGCEDIEKGKTFVLSIEPNVTSPSNRFMVKLRYLSRDIEIAKSFYSDLDSKIIDLIGQMEKL